MTERTERSDGREGMAYRGSAVTVTTASRPGDPGSGRSGLLVSELFGPTFQGEGPATGKQALFVRLSRCNLRCPGCDTPYTWDWTRFDPRAESRRRSVEEITAWVIERSPRLVVVTGGEPLLQQSPLIALAERLAAAGRRVEIETNGTVAPDPALVKLAARFVVSPKVPSFAHPDDQPIVPAALRSLAGCGRSVFKFVATTVADLDAVAGLVDAHDLAPVWIMPAAMTSHELVARLRELAAATLARGWHLSGRLHLLLWEDARGR